MEYALCRETRTRTWRSRLYYIDAVRFDPDQLDLVEPFDIDRQSAHLFKHPHLGLADVFEIWESDPLSTRRSHPPTG